jgi:hypothetical protein
VEGWSIHAVGRVPAQNVAFLPVPQGAESMTKGGSSIFNVDEPVLSSGVGLVKNRYGLVSSFFQISARFLYTSFVREVSLLFKEEVPDVNLWDLNGRERRFGSHNSERERLLNVRPEHREVMRSCRFPIVRS